jgi:hypothetical protein
MAIYYIKNDGSDNYSGLSDASAWQTIAKVNSKSLSPGDQALFNKGDAWRETLTVPSSGDASNYIAFSSYGTGDKPRILGSVQAINWTNVSTNIWKSDTSVADPYATTFDGDVFFVGIDTSVTRGVHKTYNASFGYLTQEYNWTSDSSIIYVYASSDPDSRYTAVEVSQREYAFYLNQKEYIKIDGIGMFYQKTAGVNEYYPTQSYSGFTLRNCEIAYNGTKDGVGFGSHVVYDDMLIEYNVIHDCGRRGISVYNYGNSNISNIIIQNNILYNGYHTTGVDIATGSTGTSGNLDDLFIRNNLIYDDASTDVSLTSSVSNYVDGDGTGSGKIYGFYFYNNIVKYTQFNGLSLTGVKEARIYNNTFYGHNKNATRSTNHINMGADSEGVNPENTSIKNNIFYTDLNYDSNGAGCEILLDGSISEIDADYNLYYRIADNLRITVINGVNYYRTTTSWANYNASTGWESHSPVPCDPKFISSTNYHLQADSSAIHAGVQITDISILTDYDGVSYHIPPSIGAYEYSYTPPSPALMHYLFFGEHSLVSNRHRLLI